MANLLRSADRFASRCGVRFTCLAIVVSLAQLLVDTGQSRAQAAAADAQEPVGHERLVAAIDQLVEKSDITPDGPGIAILVQQPGRLLFKKGYGLANLKSRAPITSKTMFELASVSKSFTATAVLILHDRGQLSIDDDVRQYLPELPQYHENRPIRIRDLLHHVSGLPDYMSFENVPARHETWWSDEDYAAAFSKQRKEHPLDFPTGAKYEYNNTNYMLLGLLIERVAQKPFGLFLRDEVFVPAGMQNSFVYESPRAAPKEHAPGCIRALGYEWRKKKQIWAEAWGAPPLREETLLTVGDGGIWTNLEDMALWDLAVREGKLLKEATWKMALKPSKTRDGKTNEYGLGWTLYRDDSGGLNGYGHEGSWGGFRTSYYRYLAADRTTVVLSNRGTFDPDKFWYGLEAAIEKHLSQE